MQKLTTGRTTKVTPSTGSTKCRTIVCFGRGVAVLVLIAVTATAQEPDSVSVNQLNSSRDELPKAFSHDFASDGLPAALFSGPAEFLAAIRKQPNGIGTTMHSQKGWTSRAIALQIQLKGDFDVEASFENLKLDGDGNACLMLCAALDDEKKHQCRMVRMRSEKKKQVTEISVSTIKDDKRIYTTIGQEPCAATAGRLRVARRGETMYYLIAEDDKLDFRIVGHNKTGAADSLPEGITLQSDSSDHSTVDVVWTGIRIRAAELFSPTTIMKDLNAGAKELSAEFHHSFKAPQVPMNLFDAFDGHLRQMQPAADGLSTETTANGNWTAIDLSPRIQMQGDFDAIVEFDQLKLEGEEFTGVMMTAELDDEAGNICRVFRVKDAQQRQHACMSLSEIKDGTRFYGGDSVLPTSALAGKLRLSRRGGVVYASFAPDGSDTFEYIGQRKVTASASIPHGLKIRTIANGTAGGQVRWKSLTIKGAKLLYHPLVDKQRKIAVMNVDGSDAKILTEPPDGFTHVGSPEWSPDGKRIAFDASLGGTNTSHIVIMNADGSEMEDLGPGSMPSFSPDGDELVFSENGFGIIQMSTDGTGRYQLTDSGWGCHWSPKGKHIGWIRGKNITQIDLETDEESELFTARGVGHLRQIFWNFCWSNDGRYLAFKARENSGSEVIGVADTLTSHGFKTVYSAKSINADISWSPDDSRILFTARESKTNQQQIYAINREREQDAPAEPLLQLPDGWTIFDCDWSPDGKRIVFSTLTKPLAVEWTRELAVKLQQPPGSGVSP